MAEISVQFISDGVTMPDINQAAVTEWLAKVIADHGRIPGELVYIFCDDEQILKVNREFLNHDYYTDIITFDYTRGKLVRGDMYISLDTVRSNAEALNVDYMHELLRVIVHGVLHLCGINDKGPGEREIMEQHEDRALAMFKQLNIN